MELSKELGKKMNTAYMHVNEKGLIEIGRAYLWVDNNPETGAAIVDRIGETETDLVRWEIAPANLQPLTIEAIAANLKPTLATLAVEAIIKYKRDPARVARACEIAHAGKIKKGFSGKYIVESSNGLQYYEVQKGACTCPDSIHSNICKHRIAMWLICELIQRPERPTPEPLQKIEYRRAYCEDCISYHWVEIAGARVLCHGEKFAPASENCPPTHYTKHRAGSIWFIPKLHAPESMPLEWQLAHEIESR